MSSEVPSKADIATIFKRLRNIATNKVSQRTALLRLY